MSYSDYNFPCPCFACKHKKRLENMKQGTKTEVKAAGSGCAAKAGVPGAGAGAKGGLSTEEDATLNRFMGCASDIISYLALLVFSSCMIWAHVLRWVVKIGIKVYKLDRTQKMLAVILSLLIISGSLNLLLIRFRCSKETATSKTCALSKSVATKSTSEETSKTECLTVESVGGNSINSMENSICPPSACLSGSVVADDVSGSGITPCEGPPTPTKELDLSGATTEQQQQQCKLVDNTSSPSLSTLQGACVSPSVQAGCSQGPKISPKLGKYWPADILEKLKCSEDTHFNGDLQCAKVLAELKCGGSLIRITEHCKSKRPCIFVNKFVE